MTAFGQADGFTLGIEEEFQFVDPDTGELVSRLDEMVESEDRSTGQLQSELFQSMIETATPVCQDIAEAREEVRRLRGLVADRARESGTRIAASGTHPFARWEDREITPETRYEELIREVRLPIKRELVFGQHVHVAVGSAAEAVHVTNEIRDHLPLILALSTNAPFWRGMDSGLQSARVRVFDAMPRSGTPRRFDDWADLEGAVNLLKQAGSIEDMTKIWWDVRPRPALGTVEVRIADLPTSIDESVAIAGLTQALVARLAIGFRKGEAPPTTSHPEAIRENRWRALRDGLEAEFIELDAEGKAATRSVPARFERTREFVEPVVDELGLKNEMATLEDILARGRTGADRQREVYEETGEFAAVVHEIAARTEQ